MGYLPFYSWLILLNVLVSSCIHYPANNSISFFIMAEKNNTHTPHAHLYKHDKLLSNNERQYYDNFLFFSMLMLMQVALKKQNSYFSVQFHMLPRFCFPHLFVHKFLHNMFLFRLFFKKSIMLYVRLHFMHEASTLLRY